MKYSVLEVLKLVSLLKRSFPHMIGIHSHMFELKFLNVGGHRADEKSKNGRLLAASLCMYVFTPKNIL